MTGSVDHLHAALLSAQSQFQTLIEAETSRTDASNTAKTAFKIAEASILFLERPHLLSSSQARYERGMLRLMLSGARDINAGCKQCRDHFCRFCRLRNRDFGAFG